MSFFKLKKPDCTRAVRFLDEQQVNLLDLDLCASFLEFGSDRLGLVLGDAFLEVLRSAIDESCCWQARTASARSFRSR